MKSFFGRQGGKTRSRDKIYKFFPPNGAYKVYVEPFVGAGSLFLGQKTDKEVINDIDKDIYNIWRDMKSVSKEQFDKLEFNGDENTFNKLLEDNTTDSLQRLYRNLYISFFSFASFRKYFDKTKTKDSMRGNRDNIFNRFQEIHDRLKGVTILNKDYKNIIKKYDSDNTLFYLDPPYFQTNNKSYSNKNIDFEELAKILKDVNGYFVLSINNDPYIRKVFKDFNIHQLPSVRYTATMKVDTTGNELVITNFNKF